MSAATDNRIEVVKGWLLARKPEFGNFDPDFDLIENRVIDSLSFMEFVFFLEEILGRELEASTDTVENFRTLRAIEENVFDAH